VVFLENIEQTDRANVADDLFRVIRGLHNRRNDWPEMKRMTVCLVGQEEVNDVMPDMIRTPYNIGDTIRFPE